MQGIAKPEVAPSSFIFHDFHVTEIIQNQESTVTSDSSVHFKVPSESFLDAFRPKLQNIGPKVI